MPHLYKPYAFLGIGKGGDHDNYYLRFSPMCVKSFGSNNRARVMKSTDGGYIVIEPYQEYDNRREMWTRGVKYQGSAVFIYVTGFVNSGFLNAELFGTGKKYKVKKDSKGRIYVCLNDVYEGEDGDGE